MPLADETTTGLPAKVALRSDAVARKTSALASRSRVTAAAVAAPTPTNFRLDIPIESLRRNNWARILLVIELAKGERRHREAGACGKRL
jgi:hypothetical protein